MDVTSAPPPRLRSTASPAEAVALSDALGLPVVLTADDAAALLDPRGRRFQRLEWLGDSLLDQIAAHHLFLVAERGEACCGGRSHAQVVSDRDLAVTFRRSGLLDLLDWRPSAHRQADLVEACVAAAWLAGGWRSALAAAATLVHRPFTEDEVTFVSGLAPDFADPPCTTSAFRRVATLGSYVLEAAASTSLFASDDGDEGRLTARRHPLLSGRALLAVWDGSGDCGSRDSAHRVDHVQTRLGLAQLRAGAGAALRTAAVHVAQS